MSKRPKPFHRAEDFGIAPESGDDDLFRWFLLSFLFGKPIQSSVAARTWKLMCEYGLDNPWEILKTSRRRLVRVLDEGRYTRYDEVTARSLQTCMEQLLRDYDGSLMLMYEYSENEDEFSRRLQEL